ncbi:MAG: hypothetical protein ACLP9L_18295 [Thermoguttaceae bacterium]
MAYFRNATGLSADPPEKPARSIREIIDDIWANYDRDYNVCCLVRRLQRIEKEMADEARPLFAAFGIADGQLFQRFRKQVLRESLRSNSLRLRYVH